MKQYGKFKLGVLLLASAGLASCSSDDTFSGSKGQSGEPVKTQFAISVPAGKAGRLAQNIVQGQNPAVFRGMNNINLISFNAAPAAGETGTEVIKLGSILDNELQANTSAKVYYEVPIEVGTTNFLFYGEAYSATPNAKTDGALKATIGESVDGIKFELLSIAPDAENNSEVATLEAALNQVAGATDGTTAWKDATSDLKKYYEALISLKAGSATSVKLALADLKAGVEKATATGEEDLKTAISNAIKAALTSIADCTYPQNEGLPDGAAQVKWTGAAFDYINFSNVGSLAYTSMANFVYPASLYYTTNTAIKTSTSRLADQYGTDWDACLALYNGGGTSVEANTQSVALVNQIQYAVGRLDVAAKFASATVKDNLQEDFNTAASEGITLDGILIGGQKNADWQFAPLASSEEYTIYDASVTSTKLGTADIADSIMAQSLALSTTAGTNVNFALELTNNTGNAFTGVDGIVPAGAKFYLVGRLVPQADKAGNKVFAQAYNTKANVTISSLAHAYNCIPDLKNPKLELGLSVKLEWTEGLVQDVTID